MAKSLRLCDFLQDRNRKQLNTRDSQQIFHITRISEMCGIFCLLMCNTDAVSLENAAKNLLTKCRVGRRGPDCTRTVTQVTDGTQTWALYMQGFVLHLRGVTLTPQPAQCDKEGVLLWNGEIFGGVEVACTENDTAWLSSRLGAIDDNDDGTSVPGLLAQIQGPWACVYYQRQHERLWIGRDLLGRRSLLWKLPSATPQHPEAAKSFLLPTYMKSLLISSVAVDGVQLAEVPTDGVYCMDLRTDRLTLFPWTSAPSGGAVTHCQIGYPLSVSDTCLDVKSVLTAQLESRVDISDPLSQNLDEIFDKISSIREGWTDELEMVLSRAVKKRVELQSGICARCIRERLAGNRDQVVQFTQRCGHARVAILFSGGIDCMMVAALAHRHVPTREPIDLLNVAFQKKTKPNRSKTKPYDVMSSGDYLVPDRVTGLAGWQELRQLYPDREWTLYHINVTAEELIEMRDSHIRHLVSPLSTVLDDSIGCAVWFAARGRGLVQTSDRSLQETNSTARVLLLGMGADEQLGGYTRHRTAFSGGGLRGLVDEIRRDIDRISVRNLGRDDRIVSDHAKEARFPFLDEEVVAFLNSLPCQYKMDLTLPRGYGEKFILRHLAHKLGLKSCTNLPKRAIQFGSRIAKLEGNKEKASDTCERLNGVKTS